MIWQLIYIGLILIGFGLTAAKHGEPKKGNENAWTSLVAMAIVCFILYKGGFFDVLIQAL